MQSPKGISVWTPDRPALRATNNQEQNNMKARMIGATTISRKYVAALSHYQTKLRDAPLSLDNDWSAAR
jgi:hypothetical protein